MDKTGPNPFSVWYTEVHSRDKTAIKPKWNTGFWNPDLCLTPGALSNGRGAFFLCFSVEQDSEAQGPQNSSHKFGAPICEILCLVPRKKPAPFRSPTGRPLFLKRSRPPGSPGCLVTKVLLVLTRANSGAASGSQRRSQLGLGLYSPQTAARPALQPALCR